MADAMIVTEALTKHYGDFPALVDLDLEVHPGEVFGFLGPNGAGKSTAIRTLMGELHPTSGTARVLGAAPGEVGHRARLGYLPSDLALWPAMTGASTLKFFSQLRNNVDWAYVDELAERLDATLDKKVGELSSGNRQKVGLIAVFMHKPDLLILDEPNAGLDPLVQHEFRQLMREVADDGRSVFLSSHTLAEVDRVADRVGIIRQGRLIDIEKVAQLRKKRRRVVELDVEGHLAAADLEAINGVSQVQSDGDIWRFEFEGDMGELLSVVTRTGRLRDLNTSEADLEDIFLTYYQDPS